MHQMSRRHKSIEVPGSDWRHRLLRLTLLIGAMAMLAPTARATDNWNVDGANGVLRVRGELTESACRLDMQSARQDVWLGAAGTGHLQRAGDRATPVVVRLMLHDCSRGASLNRDARTGNRLWSASQPAVSVSFVASADADNPQLVAVRGVSGLALRLTDEAQRDVRLGSRGAPLLLTPGQNELVYTVTPERTRAPLLPGSYWAQVDFRLDYE
ncbi:MrfE [Pseudomonas chlororaphis subsp. piscium]|uniref:fimbrial protein n=1 Tax=Pseudomonas chlororaphis TaxID=587753 RepID=UPI000F57B318|nr:fimbrial protein [Pseudomonas chlororaphis]AZC90139.1 MrfE [Pseudomonas chlororaphis subsp. piscium]